jgi:hypothetical protein
MVAFIVEQRDPSWVTPDEVAIIPVPQGKPSIRQKLKI